MNENLMHEPVLTKDENIGVVFLKCAFCGKLLWYPQPNEECTASHEPTPIGINVVDNSGMKDIFG